jgi:fructokinase
MRLGVDFGGTKIEAALLDSKGRILERERIPNPGDYRAAITGLAELTARIEAKAGVRAATIGVAMPGSVSPVTGSVRNANTTWLNGTPFPEDLAAAFQRPVRVANDANCFALSEAVDGAAAGAGVMFGAILGTGCGGGVVVGGKLIEGASGVGGEWGHTPLPWQRPDEYPGPECWCGRKGCLELWVSGSGFKRWSGFSAEAAAASDDPAARAALDLLADRLARALAVVIDIIDPDVIVFGGGFSNVDWLYPAVRGKLLAHVFSDVLRVKLVRNQHGDSSGVRGAAWLFSPEEAARTP